MHKNVLHRRFTDQVDLYAGKLGYRCGLMVFPKVAIYDIVSKGFIHRNLHDYFKTHVRNCGVLHKSVLLTPVEKYIPGEQMKKMLNYLAERYLTITWKEGQFGYEIDKLGNIRRTWALDEIPSGAPSQIVEAEVIDTPGDDVPDEDTEPLPTS
jgi:hypothetical protein